MTDKEALKHAIERTLQVYSGEILPEATFETALGADSIDMAQILKLLEEELSITIPTEEWKKVRTVGDAQKLLERVKSHD